MTRKNTVKKVPLSKKILEYLGETSKGILDLSVRIVFDFKSIREAAGISLYKNPYYYFPREISNLKKSSYFYFKKDNIYLTDKGRIKVIKNIIEKRKKEHEKWDGIWRGIIFDIPETNRKERSFLRQELKWIGCKEIQKSVWLIPFDVEKELLAILKFWKKDFKGDIRFLRIEKISGEAEIKKYFKIQ